MGFKSDIEIAQEATAQDIREIAKKLGLTEDADMYYKEMLNLLGMRTCNCTINCNTCKNCSNGSCTICK